MCTSACFFCCSFCHPFLHQYRVPIRLQFKLYTLLAAPTLFLSSSLFLFATFPVTPSLSSELNCSGIIAVVFIVFVPIYGCCLLFGLYSFQMYFMPGAIQPFFHMPLCQSFKEQWGNTRERARTPVCVGVCFCVRSSAHGYGTYEWTLHWIKRLFSLSPYYRLKRTQHGSPKVIAVITFVNCFKTCCNQYRKKSLVQKLTARRREKKFNIESVEKCEKRVNGGKTKCFY